MGRRILLTGMGGELGTRVTGLLEDDDTIEAVVGIDLDPPRGRIPRAEFHRVDPEDRARTVAPGPRPRPHRRCSTSGVQPGARIAARRAPMVSELAALAALGAAAQCPEPRPHGGPQRHRGLRRAPAAPAARRDT